jgi:hypothetical protein
VTHNLARQRAWKKANPDKVRAYQLKHNPRSAAKQYGLTVEAVRALFAAQDGKCGVCCKAMPQWPDRRTHIDHDHASGEVRGLLCSSCNRYEGWVRRNGAKLKQYLAAPPARDLLGLA